MHKVLVTGIGGMVGQGVLRNLKNSGKSLHIIGVNILEVSAGNHLCDRVVKVPYAYDPNYIERMLEICKNEKVELIIPTTDYEGFILSKNASKFPCEIAVSGESAVDIFLDKYKTYVEFHKNDIPFAASYLPSNYQGEFTKNIVKPRDGRGSRDIHLNPKNPRSFDDSFVIQDLLEGDEITTSFYVDRNRKNIGSITFKRSLSQGATSVAEVVFEYDQELEKIIEKMIKAFDIKGSCNIQSKVTDKGIIPFEINCRISGTNSIRSQFGFDDVVFTLNDFLLKEEIKDVKVLPGSAIRCTVDVIYPGKKVSEINNNQDNFYIY